MSDEPTEGPAPELSLVLPSHNEITLLGSTVTNLVTGLEERGVSYEILIIENGSRDGTLRLARMLAAQLDGVRLLHLPIGDYGAALAAGFRAARGRYVVNFDVDYYDLSFLDAALGLLEDEKIAAVIASKRAPGASDRRPVIRRVLTAGFTTVLHLLLGLEVSDAHGMKVLRREVVRQTVDDCQLRGSLFDVELVTRLTRDGAPVRELPATVVERRPPRTGLAKRSAESLLGALHLRLLVGPPSHPRPGKGGLLNATREALSGTATRAASSARGQREARRRRRA